VGLWAKPPAAGRSGAKPLVAAAILQPFSTKYAFLGMFWHKFLLKTRFLNV